jgi:hypothetical protein
MRGGFRSAPPRTLEPWNFTKEGAIWYSPRGSQRDPAFGVLYPDMDKITTLGAYYLNGPPGYPFKPATSPRQTAQ